MRTRGDGSLYKRASDNIWIGRVELPSVDGRRRYKTVSSKNRNEAIKKLKALRADVDAGRVASTPNTTVAKWLDRWLDEIHGERIRPTTRRDYAMAIRVWIKPAIGSKRLDKLTPEHVRQMHRFIGPRRAAEKAHMILQKALGDAVREGLLTRNVAQLVYKPKYPKNQRTSLSPELAKRVLATAFASRDVSEATRWAAAFLTGARQGELLGLEWDRVDFDVAVMDVSWQLQQLPKVHGCGAPNSAGEYHCGKLRPGFCPKARWDVPPDFEMRECHRSLVWTRPKTNAGSRLVPIIPPLLAKLRELKLRDTGNPHGLVWHHDGGNPVGRPIDPHSDYQRWKRLLIDAEVITEGQTLPLHVARHTTATLLRAAGVDEQTRMEILGHASVDSQRVYAHADQSRHLAAMGSLAELLG